MVQLPIILPLSVKECKDNMHIEHIALWTEQLEKLRNFYETYFQAVAGRKYINPQRQFESYFLQFTSGTRLELMQIPELHRSADDSDVILTGFTHIAFSVGSVERVDALTAQLESAGYKVVDRPRYTGDGYYESCVLDPDGNRLEITV
jgi:lactoylglutathione lyase